MAHGYVSMIFLFKLTVAQHFYTILLNNKVRDKMAPNDNFDI